MTFVGLGRVWVGFDDTPLSSESRRHGVQQEPGPCQRGGWENLDESWLRGWRKGGLARHLRHRRRGSASRGIHSEGTSARYRRHAEKPVDSDAPVEKRTGPTARRIDQGTYPRAASSKWPNRILLPVIEVLRWHVDTWLETEEQRASELLFPSLSGGFRSATVLTKPFADVSRRMGLGYAFTPRGMRRTFNDLDREAQVKDLVTRSISGHATEAMQRHYGSVRSDEKRDGVAKVTDLMAVRLKRARHAESAPASEHHSGPVERAASGPESAPSGAQVKGGGAHPEKAS